MAPALSTLCSRAAIYVHTLCPSREDEDGPRTVKLLAVSSLGRIVVYSELQPSEDRVKVTVWLHNVVCACVHACK